MISLFFALFFVSNAVAGLPSEDPAISALRAQFLQGKTPTLEDLRLGTTWACQSHNAVRGYQAVVDGLEYRFDRYASENSALESYVTLIDQVALAQIQNNGVDPSQIPLLYIFNEGHLVAQPYFDSSYARVHLYLRMVAQDRLLVEVTSTIPSDLPPPTQEKRMELTEPATLYPQLRLMGYDVCSPVSSNP